MMFDDDDDGVGDSRSRQVLQLPVHAAGVGGYESSAWHTRTERQSRKTKRHDSGDYHGHSLP